MNRLLRDETFSDVSLVCPASGVADGRLGGLASHRRRITDAGEMYTFKAHKVILAACSPFFENVLLDNPCEHPIIVLPGDVSAFNLQLILDFVYRGEAEVPNDHLVSIMRTAAQLQIKGLSSDLSSAPPTVNGSAAAHFANINNNKPVAMAPAATAVSRESSLGPSSDERPASQMSSHYLKRKSSPRFRFTKRKCLRPMRYEEEGAEEEREEDGDDEDTTSEGIMLGVEADVKAEETSDDMPVDFTIKSGDDSRDNSKSEKANSAEMHKTAASHDKDDDDKSAENLSSSSANAAEAVPADDHPDAFQAMGYSKAYTKRDMALALEALRVRKLSLTRASELYNIPATTLWQRANRMGISTPKKEASNKTWSDHDLNNALDALRNKTISANKAAKVYGIPSSTLYKIARKENIELATPFNAVQTTWSQEDLERALEAIRKGTPVQKAAAEHGIPSGTLYGRCKKFGIELCKTAAVHWSEEDMNKALDSVRNSGMSINQAAIHHNLPYSSLYGRINRLKRDNPMEWQALIGSDIGLEYMASESPVFGEAASSVHDYPYHPLSFMSSLSVERLPPPHTRHASAEAIEKLSVSNTLSHSTASSKH